MTSQIALYVRHPSNSIQCCNGIMTALFPHYKFKLFTEEQVDAQFFDDVDMVAFPGGIGDSDLYYDFFKRKTANLIADYVANGGRYLGICMGAYWAGSDYFDIMDSVEPEQYIKRPFADVRRSFSTTAAVTWEGTKHDIFFYDGCALVGNPTRYTTVATYTNGDAAAIIQGRIGLIGPHPESQQSWFDKPYLESCWHQGRHHELLLDFVNTLMQK